MELETFNKIFEKLVEGIEKVPYPCLISERAHPNVKQDIGHPEVVSWLQKILRYNVPRFSQFRGLCVPVIYKATLETPSTEDVELANILGWVYQIHQQYMLMLDDIGDQSVQRFGQQTWHTLEEVKPQAINDLALTEHIAYKILRYYFGHLGKTYHKMLDLLLSASYVTCIGQHVEISHLWEKCPDKFCYEFYFQKVILKTSYCMYNVPFKLAILFAGITEEENKEIWELVDEITLELGYLIQIQDDYIDNFHETNEDDIRNGSCNWIFLKAKELCNAEQWEILRNNYGCDDKEKISVVKELYEILDVKKAFLEEQKKRSDKLKDMVSKIPPKAKGVGVGTLFILNALCTCTESDNWH